jgi:predicted DNA-binding transcriptional regulator YafY
MKKGKNQKNTKKSTKSNSSGARMRLERIFKLVGLIQNANAAQRKINVTTLKTELEVDRATVMRDLDFLRMMGVGVAYNYSSETYELEDGQGFLPAMDLKAKDYLLLEFIQQCLAQYAQTQLGQEMMETYQRLFGIFVGKSDWNKWSKSVLFRLGAAPTRATMEIKIFNLLHRAIHEKRLVSFTYKSPKNSRPREKIVEPHLMTMNEGRWYLYGTDNKNRHLTPFAFPRISDIQITKEKFQSDPPKHPRHLLQHSFGAVISSDPPFDIVIEFESAVVERLKESTWHPRQKLEDLPDGRARLTLPLNSTLEVKPWILSWGPYARVTAPDTLAAEITETIRHMADRCQPNA